MLQEELPVKAVVPSSFWRKISQLLLSLSGPRCVFVFIFSLVVFHLLANNWTIEMYCILEADKLRRISSLQSTNALQFLQI